ncbi:MAG: 3-oxoacyl-ACP synthase III [Verrucomicrobia bacterium TMED40]|nr:MAG: 3-oxoacyl-ACP synthase III [Verrucomicrobia bacterium TMED40]
MRFSKVGIEAMSYALPGEVTSSTELEGELSPLYEKLNLQVGRLELMTGIKERRFWPSDHLPSSASAEAGVKLLKQGINRSDVDLLIHSAVCRDRLEPATASYVHRAMGLGESTQILDVSNACLGFLNSIILASSMIESGQIKRAIITAGENGKPLVDETIRRLNSEEHDRRSIKPYFANLTIGAAAVAWSIARKDLIPESSPSLGYYAVQTDTSYNQLCEGDAAGDGLFMQTDSEELLHAGISVAKKAWEKFTSASGRESIDPDLIVTHQVGKAHTQAVLDSLGLNPEKNYSTFEHLGNCGSVSLPISYALACESDPSSLSSKTVLLGIGSGLSSLFLSLND